VQDLTGGNRVKKKANREGTKKGTLVYSISEEDLIAFAFSLEKGRDRSPGTSERREITSQGKVKGPGKGKDEIAS